MRPPRHAPNATLRDGVPSSPSLEELASDRFGIAELHPWQKEAVDAVLQPGGRVLLVAPTGGGKSLCYQLPAAALSGTALIISPLISLMEDQVRALEARGIAATYIASSLSTDESRERLRRLRAGEYEIAYVSPERLGFEGFSSAASAMDLSLVAVDEAHCIVQWGHDFRPDYLRIGTALERLRPPRVIACTATATPAARDEIVRQLGWEARDPTVIVRGFARPNLHLDVEEVTGPAAVRERASRALNEALGSATAPEGAGIVYCATRKGTERVADELSIAGWGARAYHAGMPGDVRKRVADQFAERTLDVVVATNAFGMGIDRPDVRIVVHAQPPGSLEAYYQEVGRAGRDGNAARGLLLLSPADVALRRRFCELSADGGPAEPEVVAQAWSLFRALLTYVDAATCRHDYILRYFGDEAESLGGCGHCDVCLSTEDDDANAEEALDLVRRALAGVARTKQRAGLTAVAGMLRGEKSARLARMGLDTLSTFGVLGGRDHDEIMAILRVCIAAGWIDLTTSEFPVPFVTTAGWKVMKGETQPPLRLPRAGPGKRKNRKKPSRKSKRRGDRSATVEEVDGASVDAELLESLRARRLALAKEKSVPAYVVCPNQTLVELAAHKPSCLGDLETIHGLGPARISAYGEDFLQVLRDHA